MNLRFKDLSICNYDKIEENTTLSIIDGKFSKTIQASHSPISLKGYVAYPGLINSHDHLLGTYFPKVGNGPYLNWRPWDEDLKKSKLYDERRNFSTSTLYKLGAYRQILSATTTVCDHMPHSANQKEIAKSYIRIIDQYCLAHEISSYELNWGRSHEIEITEAKKKNIPFVTHIEEGFDLESLRGIPMLNDKKGLFENSVLVHCIGCSLEDIHLIKEKKSSVVWCPNSNIFMFDKTANIKQFINNEVNICLGTDSPMSGGISLLEEIKFAKSFFKKKYQIGLSSQFIMKMVTNNPARAFKLEDKIGYIKSGFLGDMFLLKKQPYQYIDYYDSLVNVSVEDIAMVIKEGTPLYFKEELSQFLPIKKLEKNYTKVLVKGKNSKKSIISYLIGKPMSLKKHINELVGFNKNLPFFPINSIN